MSTNEHAGQVVLLYGPKAVGKSVVARVLEERLGVRHVDADALILDLISRGVQPHPDGGWLGPVEHVARATLAQHPVVSVEATGAYSSDWVLKEHLEAAGVRVIPILVWTNERTAMARLESRNSTRKVAVGRAEAARIYQAVDRERRQRRFAAVVNTSDPFDEDRLVDDIVAQLRR